MPDENQNNDQPVTVEDLLRLKRHEQPDEAFWAQFDRELHQKTLRTLVKQRPSTRSLWAVLGRWQAALPLAGAAAFALSLAVSNDLLKVPTPAPQVAVAALPTPVVTPQVQEAAMAQPVGSPSFVVSALPSQEAFSTENYRQVPASRAMTPAHRPDVQFVGGSIAAAIPHTGYAAGIY